MHLKLMRKVTACSNKCHVMNGMFNNTHSSQHLRKFRGLLDDQVVKSQTKMMLVYVTLNMLYHFEQ